MLAAPQRSPSIGTKTKGLLRDGIARVPGLRFWVARALFMGPNHNPHRFWGVFKTYAEAQAHVPAKFCQGFDAPISGAFSEQPHVRDETQIRIFAGLICGAKTVFDLGGSVGISFYQYRTVLAYPPDLLWTVCDLPNINEEGQKIAAQRGETQLTFTHDRADASGTDIYMTNGALQYLDESLATILAALKKKPRNLLVNRVPLIDSSAFYTLQHMGYSVVPYHISNRADFISELESIGYRLVASWKNDRFCDILLRPDHRVSHYYGFHFVRADG